MIKVGLTGGIASGKTRVATWFVNQGITVFDADQSVHVLLEKPTIVDLIRKEFGDETIENGKINRMLLGKRVFSDTKLKIQLEEILHPLVLEEMLDQCKKSEFNKEKLIILDVPLLLETGWEKYVDEVWVVYVLPQIQLSRLVNRSGCSINEAKQRVAAQMCLEDKINMAHRVIDNSGDWKETEKQLEVIWREYVNKE